MPKRLMFWNIENFSVNKINNPSQRRQKGSTVTRNFASIRRRAHITSHVTAAVPDIIVVVEIETAYAGRGQLVSVNGTNGCIALLNAIRLATGNANWMLVPPLQTGPNEGVAVFYDSTRLIFTGPNTWPGGGAGVTSQAPGGGTGPYPGPQNAVLGARVVPANALQNVGVNENHCAAKIDFTFNANNVANNGNPIAYAGRAPYMVTFAEMNAAVPPAVVRNLTIFAVHSPAKNPFAGQYLQQLADTAEITNGIAGNEVRVVAGDFNVNLMTLGLVQNANYAAMQAGLAAYTLALTPVAPAPMPMPNGYQGYFATHIKSARKAVYWSTNALNTYYPGYGYIGSDLVNNLYAIDNIFTRYGGGVAPPVANNFTIINPFSGSPFGVVAPTPGGAPPGTVAFAGMLLPPVTFAYPPPAVAPAFNIARKRIFTGWSNYGYVRSTSDHLALVMDI